MRSRTALVLLVAGLAAMPFATAGHDWWNSTYYSYLNSSVSDSTLAPGQGFTFTVSYKQTYNGYTTLSGYYCCWSGRLWTSGAHHNSAGSTRTVGIGMTAPSSPGTYELYGFILSALTAYPTPDYRNGYTHSTFTVVGDPSKPSLGEDHSGRGWTTHNSPHWYWGGVSVPHGGINQWQVHTSWGGDFTTGATSYHPTLGTGAHYIQVRAQNNVGRWGPWSDAVWVYIDTTPPNPPTVAENHAGGSWTNHNHPNFYWSDPGDAGSGVGSYVGEINGGQFGLAGATSHHPTLADGIHSFRAYAVDRVGLRSGASNTVTVKIDTVPPATTISNGGPAVVKGATTYVTSDTPFRLSATDALSGVSASERRIDSGSWGAVSGDFEVTGPDGARTVYYRSRDVAGNTEAEKARGVFLDNTPPSVAITRPSAGNLYLNEAQETTIPDPAAQNPPALVLGKVRLQAAASDAGVGVGRVDFLVDGVLLASDSVAPYEHDWDSSDWTFGEHVLVARAYDLLGSKAESKRNVTVFPMSTTGAQRSAEAIAAGKLPFPTPNPGPLPNVGPGSVPNPGEVPNPGPLPSPGGIPPRVPTVSDPVFGFVVDPKNGSVTYNVGFYVDGQFVGLSGRIPPGGP